MLPLTPVESFGSYISRTKSSNEYATLFLKAENRQRTNIIPQTIEDCMKKLQIAVLEKKRKVVAYLFLDQYNVDTGVCCKIYYDRQNRLIMHIETDLYISNTVGILKILAQIKNLTLINCLPRTILNYDKTTNILQVRNQNKITTDIENYYELVTSGSEFIEYVKNINIFNIPDSMAVSLPFVCYACIKYPEFQCEACDACRKLKWDNIFGTYKLLQTIITKFAISRMTLRLASTIVKHEDKITLEDNTLFVPSQKREVTNKIKKIVKLRWCIIQPIIRGKHSFSCLDILKYYNFDKKLTESLEYMKACMVSKKE